MTEEYKSIAITDEMLENLNKAILTIAFAAENARREKDSFDKMSEDERQQKENISTTWGSFGWIKPLKMPFSCFENIPSSKEEADYEASKFCQEDELLKEWEATKADMWYTQFTDDFEEAILAFKNQMYKSCALLLVSIIDGSLIYFQRENEKKKVCKGASSNFYDRICNDTFISEWPDFISLHGLHQALNQIFIKVDFFKEDSEVINRHLLAHGVMARKVNKIDCIQLFLILRELSEMILYYACDGNRK